MNPPIVDVRSLQVTFRTEEGWIHAVNGVDLAVQPGQTVALLGESGCGKSVMLKSLLRLHPRNRTRIEGQIQVAGQDVTAMGERDLSRFRGKTAAMVFQEPMLAFDPVFTVGQQIIEAVRRHERCSHEEAQARALEMFERVQIPSARKRLDAYPHEMSGGMRQRAMIALALSCRPALLLADEPTTALDATVQIQILLLLRRLQQELGMSMIFVTHDVGVAIEIADRVAVMYAGQVVESGPMEAIMGDPHHPYTQGLLAATVHPGVRREVRLAAIPGAPPALDRRIPECSFAPRCPHGQPRCLEPLPQPAVTGARLSRCIRPLVERNAAFPVTG